MNIILRKNNKNHYYVLKDKDAQILLSFPSLYKQKFRQFKKDISFHDLTNYEINYFDEKNIIINWDNKTININCPYNMDLFYLGRLYFQIKDKNFFPNNYPKRFYDINLLLKGIKNNIILNEINCYYIKDNKSIDFSLKFNKNISKKNLEDIILNHYKLEDNIENIKNFNLTSSIYLSVIKNYPIKMVNFNFSNNNNWNIIHN